MTRWFGEYAGRWWLTEFSTGVGVAALRDQDVVQVSHGPTLIAVGEANRAAVLHLDQFLGRALRARRPRKGTGVLDAAPRLGLADAVLLFGGRVIGTCRWNVSLTASHSDRTGCHLFVVDVNLPLPRFLLLTVLLSKVCLQILKLVWVLLSPCAVSTGLNSDFVAFLLVM